MFARRPLPLFLLTAAMLAGGAAQAQETVDVGNGVPSVGAVKEGLFPEDAC